MACTDPLNYRLAEKKRQCDEFFAPYKRQRWELEELNAAAVKLYDQQMANLRHAKVKLPSTVDLTSAKKCLTVAELIRIQIACLHVAIRNGLDSIVNVNHWCLALGDRKPLGE
jgi:hypothetical protein